MARNFKLAKFSKLNLLFKKQLLPVFLLVFILFEALFLFLVDGGSYALQDTSSNSAHERCFQVKDSGKRLQCWEDSISFVLKEQGLDKTFDLIDGLYNSDEKFAANCHSFVHTLGEFAHELYFAGKQPSLSEKTYYCGYGFYHGFMEVLLHTSNDLEQARAFCNYADSQLSRKTADAKGACFHGIGHGAVDGNDPRSEGDPFAILDPGLELCELVSATSDQLFRCTSGAFNGLEILMSRGSFGLSLNREDPFWMCRNQPEKYKRSCYTQMVIAAMNVAKQDFVKSAQFIDTISEDEFAVESLETLAIERIRLGLINYKDTLDFCRGLSTRFKLPCVKGFGEGFLKYGPPGSEYVEALRFCDSDLLSDAEHRICFDRTLSILRNWYSAEKSTEICNDVDSRYRWQNCVYR